MLLSPRMRWKLDRYRRMVRERLDYFRSFAHSTMVKQKICPACRALVDARDSRCPFCNERLGTLDRIGMRRVVSGMVPGVPRYTTLLLFANFVLFALSLFAAMRAGAGVELFGGIPTPILVALGARDYHVLGGEYWRLVTAVFLHGSIIHLAFNSLVLYDLGPAVEEMYGAPRFLVLYLVTGIASSLASLWWRPFSVMVGCSGALFGLIGVMIAYGYRHRTALGEHVKSMYVRWAIYGLVFGLIFPGIDNAAHIGGLIAGIAFGMVFSDTPVFSQSSILAWRVAGYASFLIITLSFMLVGLTYNRMI